MSVRIGSILGSVGTSVHIFFGVCFQFCSHTQHLGGADAPEDGYEEMACDGCMASHNFLKPYKLRPPVKVGGGEQEKGEVVDVTGSEESSDSTQKDSSTKTETTGDGLKATERGVVSAPAAAEEGGVGGGGESGGEVQRPDHVCELVRRRELVLGELGSDGGAGYFTSTWRSQLCRCLQCIVRRRELL